MALLSPEQVWEMTGAVVDETCIRSAQTMLSKRVGVHLSTAKPASDQEEWLVKVALAHQAAWLTRQPALSDPQQERQIAPYAHQVLTNVAWQKDVMA